MEQQIFIPKNSLVKVYLKDGPVVEGIVIAWNDQKGLLQAPGNQNRLIIYKPVENVIMVKLSYPEPEEQEEDEIEDSHPEEPLEISSVAQSQSERSWTVKPPLDKTSISDVALPKNFKERTKKLVDLRLSQSSKERKEISESMRQAPIATSKSLDFSKQPPKVETTYYGTPNFAKR